MQVPVHAGRKGGGARRQAWFSALVHSRTATGYVVEWTSPQPGDPVRQEVAACDVSVDRGAVQSGTVQQRDGYMVRAPTAHAQVTSHRPVNWGSGTTAATDSVLTTEQKDAARAARWGYVPPASRRKAQPERDGRVAAVIATGAPPELGPLKKRYAALYGQHSNRPCPWALHHAVQFYEQFQERLNARNKEVRYEQEALKLWRDQHAHCDCVVCAKLKK